MSQPPAIGPPRITDEDLANSAPTVRALLVGRLEEMWRPVARHLEDAHQGLTVPDPRMLEIGLRIVKEESLLYRLARPPVLNDQPEEDAISAGVDRRALVEGTLVEIEKKLQR